MLASLGETVRESCLLSHFHTFAEHVQIAFHMLRHSTPGHEVQTWVAFVVFLHHPR